VSSVTAILSAVAENRREFFRLVEMLEKMSSCDVDALELQATVDSEHAGRDELTPVEARNLLMKIARPRMSLP
jgi:hypothetical protein